MDKRQLHTLIWTERVISNPFKWALLVTATFLVLAWEWNGVSWPNALLLVGYGLHAAIVTLVFRFARLNLRRATVLAVISYAVDFAFVGFLAFALGGIASTAAFLMYAVLIFKAGLYYPASKASLFVVPVAVALYLLMMRLTGDPSVFERYSGRLRVFLLIGLPLLTLYTARVLERRERDVRRLNHQLGVTAARVRVQSQELQAIVQGMHDGLLVTDGSCNLLAVNPVASAIVGFAPAEQSAAPLSTSENGRAIEEVVLDALRSPERTSRRDIHPPRPLPGEEEPRAYQAVASYLSASSSSDRRVVVILRDITEENRLELAKRNFLSVVSHELRTPLSSIKGFLNIILTERAGPLSDTQREFLTIVSGQAEYLHVAINDLVEYSRIQVRRDQLDTTPVQLRDIARSVAARLLPLADEKDIQIVNRVPDDLPAVLGDGLRLDQVVSNLMTNAIKFSPEHSAVTLSAEALDNVVQFSVTDQGPGIAADQRERIFDAFYQISTGPARLHNGMGLGLAICRHIVHGLGGRLTVRSELQHGSTFTFELPRHAVIESRELVAVA